MPIDTGVKDTLDAGFKDTRDTGFEPGGSVCWGHDTGVVEDNVRDFLNNWSGDASIQGTEDYEKIQFDSGEYEESETWYIGAGRVRIIINKYAPDTYFKDSVDTGFKMKDAFDPKDAPFYYGTPTVKYKQGNSQANCEADTWHAYTIPFVCGGWVKIRLEAP